MLLVFALTLAAGVLSLVPGIYAATDWSMFRGPNGSGISNETNLPVEFGPGNNMVWKTELPPGHSSPVFGKDSIFFTGFEEGSLFTFALDRENGKIRWRREIKQTRVGELREANSPTSGPFVSAQNDLRRPFNDTRNKTTRHAAKNVSASVAERPGYDLVTERPQPETQSPTRQGGVTVTVAHKPPDQAREKQPHA